MDVETVYGMFLFLLDPLPQIPEHLSVLTLLRDYLLLVLKFFGRFILIPLSSFIVIRTNNMRSTLLTNVSVYSTVLLARGSICTTALELLQPAERKLCAY